MLACSKRANRCTSAIGPELLVLAGLWILLLPAEQVPTLAEARRVVVAGARTVTLLLLVMPDERDLHGGRAEEDECSNDRNREDGSVELAGGAEGDGVRHVLALAAVGAEAALPEPTGAAVCRAIAQRGIHVASAAASAIARHHRDRDHTANKADVEDYREEGQEGNAAQTACQAYREDGVQCCYAGKAFNGSFPLLDLVTSCQCLQRPGGVVLLTYRPIAIGEGREEV